jgi:hypothetical protein
VLRGVNKVLNDVALAIESALPNATSSKTGWKDVSPERKRMCMEAARLAIAAYEASVASSKLRQVPTAPRDRGRPIR